MKKSKASTEEKFLEWFNEVEGFGLRSERFYTSLDEFRTREGQAASMMLWLKAAYEQGFNDAINQKDE